MSRRMRRIRRIWSEFSPILSFCLFLVSMVLEADRGGCLTGRSQKLRTELCEDTLAYDLEF